jgi:hypothetical protein
MGRVAIRTVLGQKRFLCSFGVACSDGIADVTSGEALKVHRVRMTCEQACRRGFQDRNCCATFKSRPDGYEPHLDAHSNFALNN